jgi:tripartite-type tricarboxylate transporter receptor subunit TctC
MRKTHLMAIATLAWSALAFGQTYPTKPITFVVPAPPGGGLDTLARGMAEEMAKRMGTTIIVDNKGGAGGMLGAQAVARAQPDGYTVLFTHSAPVLTAPFTFAKLPYDVKRDFAFVSQIASGPVVFAVARDVPAKTMGEFVAYAKQNQGKLAYGSFGTGSGGHLLTAYLSESRGLGMTNVAYKGEAPMIQDLISGQIPFALASLGVLAPHLESGRVRALAVVGDSRPRDLPNVPTMAEAGFKDPEFKSFGWIVMMAPAATPAPIVARLEQEARNATQTTMMKARFQTYGMVPMGSTSAQFRQDYDATLPLVERLVKVSGVKPE